MSSPTSFTTPQVHKVNECKPYYPPPHPSIIHLWPGPFGFENYKKKLHFQASSQLKSPLFVVPAIFVVLGYKDLSHHIQMVGAPITYDRTNESGRMDFRKWFRLTGLKTVTFFNQPIYPRMQNMWFIIRWLANPNPGCSHFHHRL